MLIYNLILRIRHLFYDKGWFKSFHCPIPTICVGNVAVGGTGKTPATELIIKTLRDEDIPAADADVFGFEPGSLFFTEKLSIAVLSRGYKRKTKGFQQVTVDGTAEQYGDEPLQIKRKFPDVTVAVDADRVEGCDLLAHPSKIRNLTVKKGAGVIAPHFDKSDIIILDDALQYRRLIPSASIVLTTFSNPYFKDFLLPLGKLRDLRCRVKEADMVIVTKCPTYLMNPEKIAWAAKMGLKDFNPSTCEGVTIDGRKQKLLFAATAYDDLQPVFQDGDRRYIHAKFAVVFSGIADDSPLIHFLTETYRIISHTQYRDHHFFTESDVRDISAVAVKYPTAIVITTEKDAQRMRDGRLIVGENLRHRLFYAPIRMQMLTAAEQNCLKEFLSDITRNKKL